MNVKRLRKGQLTTNYTGSVIIRCYVNRESDYVLILFENGKVKNYYPRLYFSYADELLPENLAEWLTKECYGELPVYGDSDGIVSCKDYDRILGINANFRLEPDMDCIR